MEFQGLTGVERLLIQAAGLAFALAGLALMWRGGAGEEHRIELLGLKLDVSSSGLPVFLVGAAMLVSPAFGPLRESPQPTASPPIVAGPRGGEDGDGPGPTVRRPDPPAPPRGDGEPANDTQLGAPLLQPRQLVESRLEWSDKDWFRLDASSVETGSIIISMSQDSKDCWLAVLDRDFEEVTREKGTAMNLRVNLGGATELYAMAECPSYRRSNYSLGFRAAD